MKKIILFLIIILNFSACVKIENEEQRDNPFDPDNTTGFVYYDYKLIKTIKDVYFSSGYVTCDDNYIFITDPMAEKILKIDYNGNIIISSNDPGLYSSGLILYTNNIHLVSYNKIIILTYNLNFLSEINIASYYYSGIDIYDNYYLVTTEDSKKVIKYSNNGTNIMEFGGVGTGNGKFGFPSDVAIDSSGNIYVADSGNERLQVFNSSGTFLYSKKIKSDMSDYTSIKGVAIDKNDNIYVRIGNAGSNFYVIKKDGTERFGCQEDYSAFGCGISVSPSGKVVVLDDEHHSIKIYSL